MASNGTVKLFGTWASAPCKRVEWALKLKGVEYENKEEDLMNNNKSEEFLQYNPITKKVPTLVHDGKVLMESLVIVEYIDETWSSGYPILPKDPYERAQARFWAKFSDDKLNPGVIAVCSTPDAEQIQKAVTELQENLKTIEGALKGKKFFGGETIGFLDIAVGWMANTMPMLAEIVGISIVNEENLPLINAWIGRFLEVDVVKECSAPREKLFALYKARSAQMRTGEFVYKK